MQDIILLILGIFFLLISIIGSLLPVIPGPPIGFAGLLLLRFSSFVEENRLEAYDNLLWIFAVVTIVVTVLDYIVPVWGARKFGASRAGMIGAGIGVFAGLFFMPAGLIAGPFLGAVIGEMAAGKNEATSLRAGFGSFIGFLTGVLMKLIACFLMTFYFFKELIIQG